MGNLVPEEVRATRDEEENEVIRTWGKVDPSVTTDSTPGKLAHYEILPKLNGVEFEKANKIAGHRAFYLLGYGCMLNQALVQYGMSFLRRKGYTNVQTPFFMKREVMAQTAELADFGETLYKIPSDAPVQPGEEENREDLFLIATSEQPISALHMGDYLDKELPLSYAGVSTCFRKEAGSHGKDMRGIFRVHQFEKVEQFILCDPVSDKVLRWKGSWLLSVRNTLYAPARWAFEFVCFVCSVCLHSRYRLCVSSLESRLSSRFACRKTSTLR